MNKGHRDIKVGDWVQVAWEDIPEDPCLVVAVPQKDDLEPVMFQVVSLAYGKPGLFCVFAASIVGHGAQIEPPLPQSFRKQV